MDSVQSLFQMTLKAAAASVRLYVAQMAPTVPDRRWRCLSPMHEGLRPMSDCLVGLHLCGRSLEERAAKLEQRSKTLYAIKAQELRMVSMQDTMLSKGESSSGAFGSTNNLKSGPRPMQSPSRKWRRRRARDVETKQHRRPRKVVEHKGDIDVVEDWYGTMASQIGFEARSTIMLAVT